MANNKNTMIEVKNVSVTYDGQQGKTEALKDVNMEINQGDFVVLLGPSGCGKTTLLNLIAGYNKPTEGEVLMFDKAITGPGKERGIVFQSTNLYPWLTVQKNIEYGLKINKIDKETIAKLSKLYLEEIELSKYKNHYPFELSGGMKQRVALVRTLINDPKILLMDEPFGALDAITRVNMQALLRDLWHEGDRTFFLITHSIDEALVLGTRVLVMSKKPGQIIKEFRLDSPEEISKSKNHLQSLDPKFIAMKNEILQLIS